jgi:hypothetical protein
MRKEISRLKAMLDEKCMKDKKTTSGKDNQSKRPQYKDGRHPHIKDRLGHKKGAKKNRIKVINGYECVKFTSKGKIGTKQLTEGGTKAAPTSTAS